MTDIDNNTLVYEGKVIARRSDCLDLIQQRADYDQVSLDEAWVLIGRDLIAYFKNEAARRDKKGTAVAAARSRNASPNGLLALDAPTPPEGDAAINGNEIESLPEGIMEALATGKIKLLGEHPRAELLRKTVPRVEGLAPEEAAPLIKEAQRAMQQLELDMPNIQYPYAKTSLRIMPSDINRTSLFHVGSNNLPRRFCKNERLGRIGDGVMIYYQGEELRQTDEAVFRQLIHVARGHKPWEPIMLQQCAFIKDSKATKRHLSGKDSKELHDIIMRLRAGLLYIQSKRRGAFITCNLLADYQGIGDKQMVKLDPRVVLLFDSYASLDETIIYSLSGVAQKIYNYIQTIPHTGLHPILISNLFELCYGRREYLVKEYKRQQAGKPGDDETSSQKRAELAIAKKFSDFHRKNLPAALDELKAKELIIDYVINRKDEKVSIVKSPRLGTLTQEAPSEAGV